MLIIHNVHRKANKKQILDLYNVELIRLSNQVCLPLIFLRERERERYSIIKKPPNIPFLYMVIREMMFL